MKKIYFLEKLSRMVRKSANKKILALMCLIQQVLQAFTFSQISKMQNFIQNEVNLK